MTTARRLVRVLLLAVLAVLCAGTVVASPTRPRFIQVPVTSTTASGSAVIDGLRGGSLTVGRFTVRVPKGAWLGKATVSIEVPDPAVLTCKLGLRGQVVNFLVPVLLVSDVGGAIDTDPEQLQVVCLNEDKGVWELVPDSLLYLDVLKLLTPLPHFSSYGVVEGKAGW